MFEYGEYDDKLFDNDAKKDIYAKWDPSKPRSGMNFNPFETYKGNSPDASGVYPGEPRYKAPSLVARDARTNSVLLVASDARTNVSSCATTWCQRKVERYCMNRRTQFITLT